MDWLCLLVFVIYICAASEIFYVLPDDSTNISCSSQPCDTLNQYLSNNSALPAVSNVEYHFLPGEYNINANIEMRNVSNVSIIGISHLTSVKLVCWSQLYVVIFHCTNVIVRNLMFNHCNGNLSQLHLFTPTGCASLLFFECFNCMVKDTIFLQGLIYLDSHILII